MNKLGILGQGTLDAGYPEPGAEWSAGCGPKQSLRCGLKDLSEGCAGSPRPCVLSRCLRAGLLSDAVRGLSHCAPQALGTGAQELWLLGLAAPCFAGSSQTGD